MIEFPELVTQTYVQILLSFGVLVLMWLTRRFTRKQVRNRHESKDHIDQSRAIARASYITKAINFGTTLFFVSVIAIIWEISFKGLSIYFASFFTIAGVALFAQWSILSNITASVILFFFYPYKIGSEVKILDGDNSVQGVVIDITLFAMLVEREDGKVVAYPNNLAIQKAVVSIKD